MKWRIKKKKIKRYNEKYADEYNIKFKSKKQKREWIKFMTNISM